MREQSNRFQNRRERLFDLYARNWEMVKKHPNIRVEPDVDDVFICPLCMRFFERSDLERENTLTLEHVPPQSLGGLDKNCTLTCAICNNTAGSNHDKHLGIKLRTDEFFKGIPGSTVSGMFSAPGSRLKLPVDIRWSEDTALEIIGTAKSPKQGRDELQQAIHQSLQMHLRLQGVNQSIAYAAFLRIAYLQIFRCFGYGLIINPIYKYIRQQIINPEEKIVSKSWLPIMVNQVLLHSGIYAITYPDDLRSLLVVFTLDTELQRTQHAVVLPRPHPNGLTVYDWINDAQDNHLENIRLELIPEKQTNLTEEELIFCSYHLWSKK